MNFKNFDLNLLRVLQALLIERSTVRAAARLNMSQPAVSAALGRIRDALGDPVLERSGRGLEPTPFALALADDLTDALARLESVLQPVSAFEPARSQRTFRFSASDYFADFLMPRLVTRFAEDAPQARLQLMPLDSTDHLDSLERFNTDLILFLSVPIPDWMRAQEVFTSTFAIVAAKDHSVLKQAGITPGEQIPMALYCGASHGLYSPSGETKTWVDEELGRLGHRRHIRQTTSTFHSLARVVEASDLLATVPALTAHEFAARYQLDVYQHPLVNARSHIMMAWHYRSHDKPDHIWFRSLIETELARLQATTGNA
jgi:DNA-binding transcriptional LysR family regulator